MKPLALSLVLVACSVSIAAAADKTAKQSDAKPQYGTWGFDSAGADLKAKPGDDFFRYANGAWLDRVQIPADKPAYSLRLAMTDTTEQRLHELMEQAAGKAEQAPRASKAKSSRSINRSWTRRASRRQAPRR